jgi:hypothetical protein
MPSAQLNPSLPLTLRQAIDELWLEFREEDGNNNLNGGGHYRSLTLWGQPSPSCKPDQPQPPNSKCFLWSNVDYYGGNGTYTWMIKSLHVNWTTSYPYGLRLICDKCGTSTFSQDVQFKGKDVGGSESTPTGTQSMKPTSTSASGIAAVGTAGTPVPLETSAGAPTPSAVDLPRSTISSGAKAGLGIGVTVGVLFVATLVFLFARKRYRTANTERAPETYGNKQELDGMEIKVHNPMELDGEKKRYELDNVQRPVEAGTMESKESQDMGHAQEPVEMWAGDARRSRGSS